MTNSTYQTSCKEMFLGRRVTQEMEIAKEFGIIQAVARMRQTA